MARTPQRRGERKLIQVGSVWTNHTDDVTIVKVQDFGGYRYITYKDSDGIMSAPMDDLTFALRYDAKIVHKPRLEATPEIRMKDENSGKVKNVTWVGLFD